MPLKTHCAYLLAYPQLVRNCKASLIDLLESKCLDIVFANEHEVAELALVLQLVPPAGEGSPPRLPELPVGTISP